MDRTVRPGVRSHKRRCTYRNHAGIGVIAGFIGGAIHAFLYNMFAGWVGGINLEFQQ